MLSSLQECIDELNSPIGDLSHERRTYLERRIARLSEEEGATIASLTHDRDTLRAQLDVVTKERDKLQRAYDESAQKADSHRRLYEQACNDLGELRAVVKAVRVAYGNAPGRCGASDAPYRDLLYSINAALNSKVGT